MIRPTPRATSCDTPCPYTTLFRSPQLGVPSLFRTVPCNVVERFAPAGRMADVNRVAQVEMLHHCRRIGGVVVHVVAVAHLCRSTVASPVMRHHAIADRKSVV